MTIRTFTNYLTEKKKPAPKPLDADIGRHYEAEAKALCSYPPKKTKLVYKLFDTQVSKPGKLIPLFIDRKTPLVVGPWYIGKFVPTSGYKDRPGQHSGEVPYAPHLMQKADHKTMQPQRVWTMCEVPDDYNWNAVLKKHGTSQLEEVVPYGGWYYFSTTKLAGVTAKWVIAGAVRVKKILTLEEADNINSQHGIKSEYVKYEQLRLDKEAKNGKKMR